MFLSLRQLGFTGGFETTGSYFGNVPTIFSMARVSCTGEEEYLQHCQYTDHDNCGARDGLGVICDHD